MNFNGRSVASVPACDMGNFEGILNAPIQPNLGDLLEIHLHIILTGIKEQLSEEQLAMCPLCLIPPFAVALSVQTESSELKTSFSAPLTAF